MSLAPTNLKPTSDPILHVFPSSNEISNALATYVIKAQNESTIKKDTFRIAISGGSLPQILAKGLVHRDDVNWKTWELFLVDERLVPINDELSNFKSLKDNLINKSGIPLSQVHPVNVTLLSNPNDCAEDYEQQLTSIFARGDAVAFPRFDLILLGMGEDGHTGSLFPNHHLLVEELRWVAYLDDSPKPPSTRVTLTYPVLNHAHRVAFVVTGEGKKNVLKRILDNKTTTTTAGGGNDGGGNNNNDNDDDDDEAQKLPAARVQPVTPSGLVWFVDEPAANGIKFKKTEFKL